MADLAELLLKVQLIGIQFGTQGLNKFGSSARNASAAATQFNNTARRVSKTATGLGKNISSMTKTVTSLAAAFIGLRGITGAFEAVTHIEVGLISVAKTVEFTDAQLKKFEKRFDEVASRVAEPVEAMLEFGAVAGQLGIRGVQNISNFVEVISKLADATPRLASEEAAIGLAQILALTGEGVENIEKMASAITLLENATKALSDKTLLNATFIAQSTTAYGLSSQQVLALAGTLAALGQRAEISSTALARVFGEIEKALSSGGTQLSQFASVANLTDQEFSKLYAQDKLQGLKAFLTGLGELSDRGIVASDVLDDVSVNGLRALRTLGTLAKNTGELNRQIRFVSQEYKEPIELQREFERGMQSVSAGIVRFVNALKVLIKNLAEKSGIVDGMKQFLNQATLAIRVMDGVEKGIQATDKSVSSMIFGIRTLTAAVAAFIALQLAAFLVAALTAAYQFVAALIKLVFWTVSATQSTVAMEASVAVIRGTISSTSLAMGGLSIILAVGAALYYKYKDSVDEASDSLVNHKKKLDELEGSLDNLVSAQAERDLAERDNDAAGRIKAIEKEIAVVQGLRVEIAELQNVQEKASKVQQIKDIIVEVKAKEGRVPVKLFADADVDLSLVREKFGTAFNDIAFKFQELLNFKKKFDAGNINFIQLSDEDKQKVKFIEDFYKKRASFEQRRIDPTNPVGRHLAQSQLAELTFANEAAEKLKSNFDDAFANFDKGALDPQELQAVTKELLKIVAAGEAFSVETLFKNFTLTQSDSLDVLERHAQKLIDTLNKAKTLDPNKFATDDTGRRVKVLDIYTKGLEEQTAQLRLTKEELEQLNFEQEVFDDARNRGFEVQNPQVNEALLKQVELRRRVIATLEQEKEAAKLLEDQYEEIIKIQKQLNQDAQDANNNIGDFGYSDAAVRIRTAMREIEADVNRQLDLIDKVSANGQAPALAAFDIDQAALDFLDDMRAKLKEIERLSQVNINIEFQKNVNRDILELNRAFEDLQLTDAELEFNQLFDGVEDRFGEFQKELNQADLDGILNEGDLERYSAALDKTLGDYRKGIENLVDFKRLSRVVDQVGSAIGDGLTNAIINPGEDIGEQLSKAISEALVRGLIVDPFVAELTSGIKTALAKLYGEELIVKLTLEEEAKKALDHLNSGASLTSAAMVDGATESSVIIHNAALDFAAIITTAFKDGAAAAQFFGQGPYGPTQPATDVVGVTAPEFLSVNSPDFVGPQQFTRERSFLFDGVGEDPEFTGPRIEDAAPTLGGPPFSQEALAQQVAVPFAPEVLKKTNALELENAKSIQDVLNTGSQFTQPAESQDKILKLLEAENLSNSKSIQDVLNTGSQFTQPVEAQDKILDILDSQRLETDLIGPKALDAQRIGPVGPAFDGVDAAVASEAFDPALFETASTGFSTSIDASVTTLAASLGEAGTAFSGTLGTAATTFSGTVGTAATTFSGSLTTGGTAFTEAIAASALSVKGAAGALAIPSKIIGASAGLLGEAAASLGPASIGLVTASKSLVPVIPGLFAAAATLSSAAKELSYAAGLIAAASLVGGRQGLVATGGKVTGFAHGGTITGYAFGGNIDRGVAASIVNKPTLIPQVLLGEGTRSEAIMPLEKTMDGSLGVMAQVGGESTVLPIDRLASGFLGVRIEGYRTGGTFNESSPVSNFLSKSRSNTAAYSMDNRQLVNVKLDLTKPDKSSSKYGTANNYNITVNVKEPRTKAGARYAGATVARKITERLGS